MPSALTRFCTAYSGEQRRGQERGLGKGGDSSLSQIASEQVVYRGRRLFGFLFFGFVPNGTQRLAAPV